MAEPGPRWHSPFDLDELLLLFGHRWRWLVVATVVGCAVGLAAVPLLEPSYTSEAALLYEPVEISSKYVRPTMKERGAEESQVLRERFTSDEVLQRVVASVGPERLDPTGLATPRGLQVRIRKNLGFSVVDASRYGATQVIELSYSAYSPKVAAAVVEALMDVFTGSESALRTQQARATQAFLASEVDAVARRLEEIEGQLAAMRGKLPHELWFPADAQQPTQTNDANSVVLARLVERLARAEATLTNEHPEVKSLRYQVSAARKRLPISVRRLAEQHADDLAAYEQLFGAHARTRDSHAQLVERHLEASIAANLEVQQAGSRFRQLRAPAVSPDPDFPDPVLLAAGGGVVGLGLMVGWLLASAWVRPRFSNLVVLEEAAGAPIIASIPRIRGDLLEPEKVIDGVSPTIIAATAPNSAAADQYRGFLPVYFSHKRPKVVLVTSAMRGDGKSLTSANLAATIAAELGDDVLLVDADLRRPTVHRLFGADRAPGLAEILRGSATLGDCVRSSGVPGLSILPAGAPRRTRVSSFADDGFAALLDEARRDYGTIVLDTPPLLPVVDTQLLRDVAGMAILVVRANATPRDAVDRALDALGDVSGFVFNDVGVGAYRRIYYNDPYEPYREPEADDD